MKDAGARRDLPWLLAIAAVGLVLRLAAVAQFEAQHPLAARVVIDEQSYHAWARAIAGGEWLGREVFFQEPLYPYALGTLYALVGESLCAARVAHCCLWAAAILLTGLLARRAFGRAAGFVTAAAVALHGPGLLFPSLILKENLFLPLFAALALALVRSRPLQGARAVRAWLGLGVLGGLGALLRGNVLVLLPVLALWPLGRAVLARERLVAVAPRALACAAGALLVLLPVAWRNQHVGGVFALTTSGAGTNVYGGNNAENPFGRATEFSFVRGIPEHEAGDWRREAERRTGRALNPGEVSTYWLGEAGRSVRANPVLHARILWNKLRLSLGRYEVPDNHMLDWDARYVPLARLPWPDFGVTGLWGLAGVLTWVALRAARRAPSIPCAGGASELALLFALYLGTIVLTVTSDRARLPLLVPLAAFAGFFTVWTVAWIRARARIQLAVAFTALAAAALLVHVPALPASDRAEDWDERDHNLAVQWLDEPGREDQGRAIAQALLARHPRTARIRLLALQHDLRYAERLERQQTADARAAAVDLRAAALAGARAVADDGRVFPRERFRANALAGWAAYSFGDLDEAERRFGLARRFDPDDPGLRGGEALVGVARCAREWRAASALLGAEDPEREAARRRTESVLDRLQVIALDEGLPALPRAEARQLAGSVQLELGRLPNAERHFRAALALVDGSATRFQLARVLVARARAAPAGAERQACVAEAAELVAGLRREGLPLYGLDAELEALTAP
ncbi:MAG: glycosyltransferase family 39 protein [Planctomycetes bacterium]|nr:glycosyltransferase family 39 protein [Planctomycetota bacterium]